MILYIYMYMSLEINTITITIQPDSLQNFRGEEAILQMGQTCVRTDLGPGPRQVGNHWQGCWYELIVQVDMVELTADQLRSAKSLTTGNAAL